MTFFYDAPDLMPAMSYIISCLLILNVIRFENHNQWNSCKENIIEFVHKMKQLDRKRRNSKPAQSRRIRFECWVSNLSTSHFFRVVSYSLCIYVSHTLTVCWEIQYSIYVWRQTLCAWGHNNVEWECRRKKQKPKHKMYASMLSCLRFRLAHRCQISEHRDAAHNNNDACILFVHNEMHKHSRQTHHLKVCSVFFFHSLGPIVCFIAQSNNFWLLLQVVENVEFLGFLWLREHSRNKKEIPLTRT